MIVVFTAVVIFLFVIFLLSIFAHSSKWFSVVIVAVLSVVAVFGVWFCDYMNGLPVVMKL